MVTILSLCPRNRQQAKEENAELKMLLTESMLGVSALREMLGRNY